MAPAEVQALIEGEIENTVANLLFDKSKDTKNSRSMISRPIKFYSAFPVSSKDIEENIPDGAKYVIDVSAFQNESSIKLQAVITCQQIRYYTMDEAQAVGKQRAKNKLAKLIYGEDSWRLGDYVDCKLMKLFLAGKLDWEELIYQHKEDCKL